MQDAFKKSMEIKVEKIQALESRLVSKSIFSVYSKYAVDTHAYHSQLLRKIM